MKRRCPSGGARGDATRASFLLLLVVACTHRPPADFAPDPGLVARIRTIELRAPQTACPGSGFPVTYTAVLTDGSRVPFDVRYDKKHPPALHVVFLERSSAEAIPLEGGGWAADRDPLVSVRTGFRLDAALRANPSIRGSATIAPSYECMQHAFTFSGRAGATGASGEDGPPVTVRLALGRSPFYSRLIVAGVEVADAPPFFVLADGSTVPPADWLLVTSRGGEGGSGPPGRAGQAGTAGSTGCPASAGGPGGTGGSGGHGGMGGRGGSITIIASAEEPFLAGLVDGRSPGGPGGKGGAGGKGGPGGAGGAAGADRSGTRCPAGPKGSDGASGAAGRPGPEGDHGPRPRILTIPSRDVFGPRVPPDVVELFTPARRRP